MTSILFTFGPVRSFTSPECVLFPREPVWLDPGLALIFVCVFTHRNIVFMHICSREDTHVICIFKGYASEPPSFTIPLAIPNSLQLYMHPCLSEKEDFAFSLVRRTCRLFPDRLHFIPKDPQGEGALAKLLQTPSSLFVLRLNWKASLWYYYSLWQSSLSQLWENVSMCVLTKVRKVFSHLVVPSKVTR